jgi:hypothetical protein
MERSELHTNILIGKPAGRKKPLVKSRHRWDDNIKIDLIEVGFEDMD